MFLYEVLDSLKAAKVRHALVGGYALALHGLVRATMDVDLVLNLNLKDFEAAEAALKNLGLTSRLPIRAKDVILMRNEYIKNRNLIAWSFVDYKNATRQVDILITADVKDFKTEFIKAAGRAIPVVSLKDLLRMKQMAGRPQDLVDAQRIQEKLNEKRKK